MAAGVEDPDRQRERTAAGMAVAHWAEVAPDRPAIVSPHGNRTFAELNARGNQLASALRRAWSLRR